jgi:periplasmic protein TonB
VTSRDDSLPRMMRPSPLDLPHSRTQAESIAAGAGALVVHVGLVVLITLVGAGVGHRIAPAVTTEFFDIEPPPNPPPLAPAVAERLPEPKQETLKPEALEQDEPPTPSPADEPEAAESTPEEQTPAAAQAGQIVAAADEVVDFGETFVTGAGSKYVGGATASAGTAKHAVRDPQAKAHGTATSAAIKKVIDLSRAPALAGGKAWTCPFPDEADDMGVDHAVVTLRIKVAADGSVMDAIVARDPGDGFGREARRCALRKRWSPGLDSAGKATGATTVVNVRFDR